MLIPDDYWMARDKTHAADLTASIVGNARDLLGRVNLLLAWAMQDNVRPAGVASGWRPPALNAATPHAAKNSKHMTGDAIDLRDNGTRDLARWCLKNLDALDEIGLWMEDPQWTPTWVHLQRLPPGSGRRVYVPSSTPPLCPPLPEQADIR